jgi:signal transduction histidine kinase/DNA-binding response OmpR family regulator
MMLKSLKVLLVEDNPGDARLVRETFRDKTGVRITHTESLAGCIETLENESFDVVLLDLGLPDSNGLETVQTFVKKFPDTPLIVLTGLDDDEAGIAAVQAGAEDYLTKGLWAEQALPRAIHYAIERNEVSLQLKRLNKVLQAVRGVNHIIVRESDPAHLIKLSCEKLTNNGAFCFAMVCLFSQNRNSFSIATSLSYDEEAKLKIHEMFKPLCEALDSDQVLRGTKLKDYCSKCPFNQIFPDSEKFVTRLECRGKVHGLLSIARKNHVNPCDEEINLISQLANDLAFALNSIEDRRLRQNAEEEQKKLQNHLHQAQKLESIGRLAGGVAHDFNNFLNVIIGYTEMALEKSEPDSELATDLKEVLKAGKRSTEITRQLLAFARKQLITPVLIDMNQAVKDAMKMLQRIIGENINIHLDLAKEPCLIKIDPSQLDQILANLCINAKDAISGTGKIAIKTCFSQEFKQNGLSGESGEFVVLTVKDSGSGINEETLAHIFEPFFTTKAQGKGTGLGLATVFGIVKQNSGFIKVSSEPNRGTSFDIFLPLQFGKPDHQDKVEEKSSELGNKENILLVEDDPIVLKMTKKILEKLNYQVFSANHPLEAIEHFNQNFENIDLLFSDIVMPDMNGVELAKALKARSEKLKILFMSGYNDEILSNSGFCKDNFDFLQKPFSKKDLANKLGQIFPAKKP